MTDFLKDAKEFSFSFSKEILRLQASWRQKRHLGLPLLHF